MNDYDLQLAQRPPPHGFEVRPNTTSMMAIPYRPVTLLSSLWMTAIVCWLTRDRRDSFRTRRRQLATIISQDELLERLTARFQPTLVQVVEQHPATKVSQHDSPWRRFAAHVFTFHCCFPLFRR